MATAKKPTKRAPARRTKVAGHAPAPRPRAARGAGDAAVVLERLAEAMPEPRCELVFRGGWQLLVATILSAQSTDRTVNRVTPGLFARFGGPAALAAAPLAEVEEIVHATGFFRNKAKAIVGASRLLCERHPDEAARGEVPRSMEALCALPGVARKTANLVLGTAYGIASGFLVDTHAGRVARRLGLTRAEDPVEVERDLCQRFPEPSWVAMGHRLVLHGRYVCLARAPRCPSCPLCERCPSAEGAPEGDWRTRARDEGALVASGA